MQDNQREQSRHEENEANQLADLFVASRGHGPIRRGELDRFFGTNLSGVRIHRGRNAERAAESLQAEALSVGTHIAFAPGMFDLGSPRGVRLLAHEVAHVARHHHGPARVRRQGKPGELTPGVQVQVMDPKEFERQYGVDVSAMPEKKLLQLSDLMRDAGCGLSLPDTIRMTGLPLNATGVGFEGQHTWDFAVVDGKLVNVRGFRTELLRHALSKGERMGVPAADFFSTILYGERATTTLNRGQPGGFVNDWMFPFSPGASVVYRDASRVDARGFARYLDAIAPTMEGRRYVFSPPEEGSRAWVEAFGPGGRPPPTENCVNIPGEPHRRALGLGPSDPLPFEPPPGFKGRFLDPSEEFFRGGLELPPGLSRTRIGPAMLGAGVIKAGGRILVVYGAYKSTERILEAAPGEQTRTAVIEEAGGWSGALIGGALAEALGAAFVCTGTGPGAFFCLAGFGIAGGIGGDIGGRSIAQGAANVVNSTIDLLDHPAKIVEVGALLDSLFNKSDSAKKYYDQREAEGGEPSPLWPF